MDPATWICAVLADLLADFQEKEIAHLQDELDELRDEVTQLREK